MVLHFSNPCPSLQHTTPGQNESRRNVQRQYATPPCQWFCAGCPQTACHSRGLLPVAAADTAVPLLVNISGVAFPFWRFPERCPSENMGSCTRGLGSTQPGWQGAPHPTPPHTLPCSQLSRGDGSTFLLLTFAKGSLCDHLLPSFCHVCRLARDDEVIVHPKNVIIWGFSV